MEISVIRNNELVWTSNRQQRRSLDRWAGKVLRNKKLTMLIVFILAGVLTISGNMILEALFPIAIPCALDLSKIDTLGNTILTIIRKFGYWICIIMATKEIITAVTHGSYKDIGGILLKYSLGFGSLFALPWILDLISTMF